MTYYHLTLQDITAKWSWKTTAITSLKAVFELLRCYRALLPQDYLRVLTTSSKEELQEQPSVALLTLQAHYGLVLLPYHNRKARTAWANAWANASLAHGQPRRNQAYYRQGACSQRTLASGRCWLRCCPFDMEWHDRQATRFNRLLHGASRYHRRRQFRPHFDALITQTSRERRQHLVHHGIKTVDRNQPAVS